MANVQYTENMTDEHCDFNPRCLDRHGTIKVLNNKCTNKIRDSLLRKDEPRLAIPLLVLKSTYKRRCEEGAVIGVAAAAAKARPVKEQFIHSGGTSTSLATSSFHEVTIPPHSGGRRRGCRWAAAQLLVVQVGARITQVGGALPLATRAGRRWGPISNSHESFLGLSCVAGRFPRNTTLCRWFQVLSRQDS